MGATFFGVLFSGNGIFMLLEGRISWFLEMPVRNGYMHAAKSLNALKMCSILGAVNDETEPRIMTDVAINP